jgi:hypothetical protein
MKHGQRTYLSHPQNRSPVDQIRIMKRYFLISDTETDDIAKDQGNRKNSVGTRACVLNIRFRRLGMPLVAPFT